MNPEIKAKWVAALRSGEYKQIAGQLSDGDGGFCCLGVLCAISELGEWEGEGEGCYFKIGYDCDEGLPLAALADWAGFQPDAHSRTMVERIPRVVIDGDNFRLHEQNDMGKTFAQIAKAIEEQL